MSDDDPDSTRTDAWPVIARDQRVHLWTRSLSRVDIRPATAKSTFHPSKHSTSKAVLPSLRSGVFIIETNPLQGLWRITRRGRPNTRCGTAERGSAGWTCHGQPAAIGRGSDHREPPPEGDGAIHLSPDQADFVATQLTHIALQYLHDDVWGVRTRGSNSPGPLARQPASPNGPSISTVA